MRVCLCMCMYVYVCVCVHASVREVCAWLLVEASSGPGPGGGGGAEGRETGSFHLERCSFLSLVQAAKQDASTQAQHPHAS